MRLATAGNPTVLTVLYAPPEAVLVDTVLGDELRVMAPQIVSANAGWRHLGYLDGQRQRMTGGGHQARVPNRPELIEAHGYDTKYASHALRLGFQGLELTTTGRLTLPLSGPHLDQCMEVKRGQVRFAEALRRVDDVRARLHEVMTAGQHGLRPEPDWDAINKWMIHAQRRYWWHAS